MAERELRRDGQVVITHRVLLEIRIGGAARGIRGVVERHRAGGARERGGQAAGRRILAEQHVGHGIAAFHTQHPGLEDDRRVLGQPRQRERPAVGEHHHHGLAGGEHAARQLELARGQFEVRTAARFAGEVVVLADHQHGDVRGLRELHRGGNAGEIGAARIGARRGQHLQRLRRRGRDALRASVTTSSALPCARHEPSADRPSVASAPITAMLRSFVGIQRQQLAFVPEQHHGLARDGARRFAMLGREQLARLAFGVVVLHRLVEQPELFLHAQDAQHRLVELFEARRDLSRPRPSGRRRTRRPPCPCPPMHRAPAPPAAARSAATP